MIARHSLALTLAAAFVILSAPAMAAPEGTTEVSVPVAAAAPAEQAAEPAATPAPVRAAKPDVAAKPVATRRTVQRVRTVRTVRTVARPVVREQRIHVASAGRPFVLLLGVGF